MTFGCSQSMDYHLPEKKEQEREEKIEKKNRKKKQLISHFEDQYMSFLLSLDDLFIYEFND